MLKLNLRPESKRYQDWREEQINSPDYPFKDVLVDEKRIGSPEYKGIAYFWAHEYRHHLRPGQTKMNSYKIPSNGMPIWNYLHQRTSYAIENRMRRDIHHEFIKCGLILHGESSLHLSIIEKHRAMCIWRLYYKAYENYIKRKRYLDGWPFRSAEKEEEWANLLRTNKQ